MPTGMSHDTRAAREIRHGQWLAEQETEAVLGWTTPAGKHRAQRRGELVLKGAGIDEKSRVLEIGCGTGHFTETFASSGARIIAVDISPELLAKARLRNLGSQVTFCEKRFEECDAEGPFDAIIGNSILHHLDLDPSIQRMKQLLKLGGRISFAEPNMLNPQVFLERRFQYLPMFSYISPDETAFVRWKLKRKLREAGFEQIAITPFDWLHPATPVPLISLVKRVGRIVEALPLVREFAGSLYVSARLPA
jgi:2-polyprenyl-3-methyl-5-hydroxy-6-metoxy-1,4-benzoquinol methylase